VGAHATGDAWNKPTYLEQIERTCETNPLSMAACISGKLQDGYVANGMKPADYTAELSKPFFADYFQWLIAHAGPMKTPFRPPSVVRAVRARTQRAAEAWMSDGYDSLTAAYTQLQQQIAQRQQAAQEQSKQEAVIALSCVIHMDGTNELAGAINGVEYQYSIDPIHKTATASRGPAPPTDVDVSPALIRFRQGDLYVSISRATGRFSQQLKDNPYAITGTCESIHAAKF
jgi:hypothetical protein